MTGPVALEPADLSAVDAARDLRSGELTATVLARSCLDRIAERDPDVRAWAHVDPERVLADATARDGDAAGGGGADPPEGERPLRGLPVGVKDIIDTADAPTELGSALHAGRQPARDADVVAWLRDQGAIVLGKTVTTEFALFHPGPTRNPVDPTRTPGGSSSGSAAAVAARMVSLALGTQTAGSIVRPASFCGIAGWKPTFGTIGTAGVHAVAPSLDTVGLLARTVADLALVAGAVRGREIDLDLPAPRLGFARTVEWSALEPSTRAALERLAGTLDLPAVELPTDFAGLADAQAAVMAHEAAATLGPQRRHGPVSAELAELLAKGERIPAETHREGLDLAARTRELLPSVLADANVDALLVPAVLGEAPAGLHATGDPLPCRAWTLLGVPCVAVPGLGGPAGLPLGVQVVAPAGADEVALRAATTVERALP